MWWHTVTHGKGSEGGNWRMQWVDSTLHTTSEHGVSSITTADAAHLGLPAVDWTDAPLPPGRFKWTRPFRPKDEIWFLRMCHHISNAVCLSVVWDQTGNRHSAYADIRVSTEL